MVPSPQMKAGLLAAIRESPAPTRQSRRRLSRGVGVAVAVIVLAIFFGHGGLHLGSRPIPFVVLSTITWLLCGLAMVLVIRSRGQLGPPGWVLWLMSGASLGLPLTASLIGNAIWPATADAVPSHPGVLCVEMSLVWATLPLAAWVFTRRESDPVHPVALGAAMGAVAASVAGFLVGLTCPYSDPSHIVLGHILPGAVEIGVGALLGRLLMAIGGGLSPLRTGAAMGGALGGWSTVALTFALQEQCPTHIQPEHVGILLAGIVAGAVVGALLSRRYSGRASA